MSDCSCQLVFRSFFGQRRLGCLISLTGFQNRIYLISCCCFPFHFCFKLRKTLKSSIKKASPPLPTLNNSVTGHSRRSDRQEADRHMLPTSVPPVLLGGVRQKLAEVTAVLRVVTLSLRQTLVFC